MAAAARPAPPDARDARVPCPLCGGLIHPIAGKCKHCKADLTAYRAARPAASAPLPALHPAAAAAAAFPAASTGATSSTAPTLPVAPAAPAALAGPGAPASGPVGHALPLAAQTVLPPRPTGRAFTAQPAGSTWRSWPVIVIAVAMVAIVAAVVLMLWPGPYGRDGKPALLPPPPPAPARMDTQTPPATPKLDTRPHAAAPAAPTTPVDPLDGPHAAPPAAPGADPPADPSAQADPSDDDQDADASDPLLPSGPRAGQGLSSFAGSLGLAMTARLCRKLAQCGSRDDTLKNVCEAIANVPSDPPAGCPAAERCLRHIDALGCTSQPDALQMGMLLMRFRDCAEAARC
jgi:hypothetical protein